MVRMIAFVSALTLLFLPTVARAQLREERIIESSSLALDEIMSIRLRGIPRAMLADARGIAIIPNVIKASFVIGGRHGKGVLMIRDEEERWHLPTFITLNGGNIGYQIGIQSTDLILVFKTQQSIENILAGKLTLGADAAAAAGPVGRQAAAATDGRLKAEIYSYSRSRGLFAGVSVDGSILQVAPDMNSAYYSRGGAALPAGDPSLRLAQKVISLCQPLRQADMPQPAREPSPAAGPQPEELPLPDGAPPLAAPQNANVANPTESLRTRLAEAALSMARLLDDSWNAYLALPGRSLPNRWRAFCRCAARQCRPL